MPTPMVWPDTVEAVFEYLDGTEIAGQKIELLEENPGSGPHDTEIGFDRVTVVVNLDDSAIGEIDRIDKFRLEVYGNDRKITRDVAEAIIATVCLDGGWETPAALIDEAVHKSGPSPAMHPSQDVRRFDLNFWLTTRPI